MNAMNHASNLILICMRQTCLLQPSPAVPSLLFLSPALNSWKSHVRVLPAPVRLNDPLLRQATLVFVVARPFRRSMITWLFWKGVIIQNRTWVYIFPGSLDVISPLQKDLSLCQSNIICKILFQLLSKNPSYVPVTVNWLVGKTLFDFLFKNQHFFKSCNFFHVLPWGVQDDEVSSW